MASHQSATAQTVYQLKITLKGAKPPIWRRVQVLDTATLEELHHVIQSAMGWWDGHLHQFTIQGVEYGKPMPEPDFYELNVRNEAKAKLNQVVTAEKFKFLYTYDFGDGWDHEILVEKVLPREVNKHYPTCLTGRRACPPEDCGGIWGYAEFVEVIRDPNHPEHKDKLDWVGGHFDPNEFDVDEVNQQLKDPIRNWLKFLCD